MSHIDEIKDIVQMVLKSPIYDFSLEYGDVKLSFKKENRSGQQPDESSSAEASQAAQLAQADTDTARIPDTQPAYSEKAAAEQGEKGNVSLKEIVSSMVGIFYASSEPDAPPFVQVGDRITKDSVVGVIEAMKMFNELQADTDGEIVQILVENGQLIQFGQPLFIVRPN
ncbi:acetyl-CoA carboxylase biotin carboxyl carrier protein [Paenibacillus piri]|uniref:Biotin carboxyl carrier protein of acetyl-CoA carboxylase n=1 Tax=Paenibacillus piri TaxID=2547395 RepID=A0A4R5KUQ8_9BACL|nr:acetyl-CoA carboxylase biotin carboxyl carrier protein [Paenibacillus piri]TDF99466.1 acetyl-CoA carboxylase biotin carboxyl carrier protein [Paenibacillus piri]